jgi:hypothetical protein
MCDREFARVLLGAPTIYLALPLVLAHWAIVRGGFKPLICRDWAVLDGPAIKQIQAPLSVNPPSVSSVASVRCLFFFWPSGYARQVTHTKQRGAALM